MRFNCPKCNALFDANLAPGTPVQCQACQHTFPVPGGDPRPAPRIQELPRQGTSRYDATPAPAGGTEYHGISGVQTRKHEAEQLTAARGAAHADAQTVLQPPDDPSGGANAAEDAGRQLSDGGSVGASVGASGAHGAVNAAFQPAGAEARPAPANAPAPQIPSGPASPAAASSAPANAATAADGHRSGSGAPVPGTGPQAVPGQPGAPTQHGPPGAYPPGGYGPYGYSGAPPAYGGMPQGYGYGYGYGAYGYPQQYGPPPAKGGTVLSLGLIGMILSLLGIVTCPVFPVAGMILCVVAVVIGTGERRKIARGQASPNGGVGTGLVCGIIGLIGGVAAIVFTIIAFSAAVGPPTPMPVANPGTLETPAVDSYAIEEFRRIELEARDRRDALDAALADLDLASAILDDETATSQQRQRAEADARTARRAAIDAAIDTYIAGYEALSEYENARAGVANGEFAREHRKDATRAVALETLLVELDNTELPDAVRRAVQSDFGITSARERWENLRRAGTNGADMEGADTSDELIPNDASD